MGGVSCGVCSSMVAMVVVWRGEVWGECVVGEVGEDGRGDLCEGEEVEGD